MCIAKSNGSRDEGKSKNMTLAIVSLEASDKEEDSNAEDSKHEDQINQRYLCIHTTRRVGMRALFRNICLCFGQSGSRGLL